MTEVMTYIIAMKILKNTGNKDYIHTVVPKLFFNDGFSISIQASNSHYCSGKNYEIINDDIMLEHSSFELGYPSKKESLIMEYAESPERPTNTVYGHVPLRIVEEMITKHEGIEYQKTFKFVIKQKKKRDKDV